MNTIELYKKRNEILAYLYNVATDGMQLLSRPNYTRVHADVLMKKLHLKDVKELSWVVDSMVFDKQILYESKANVFRIRSKGYHLFTSLHYPNLIKEIEDKERDSFIQNSGIILTLLVAFAAFLIQLFEYKQSRLPHKEDQSKQECCTEKEPVLMD